MCTVAESINKVSTRSPPAVCLLYLLADDGIVADDGHTEGLHAHGHLAADSAQPNDSKGATVHLQWAVIENLLSFEKSQ